MLDGDDIANFFVYYEGCDNEEAHYLCAAAYSVDLDAPTGS